MDWQKLENRLARLNTAIFFILLLLSGYLGYSVGHMNAEIKCERNAGGDE